MGESEIPECAKCPVFRCDHRRGNQRARRPDFCPTVNYAGAIGETVAEHEARDDYSRISWACDEVVNAGYGEWPRVREVMEFARLLGIEKLGLAFCVGLREEGKLLAEVLKENGFQVASVCCMVGEVPREAYGLELKEGRSDIMCSPLAQAEVLNREGTELNIILGLCLGHDILFQRASKADTTTLVVKDRLLGHNPVTALHLFRSYFREKLTLKAEAPHHPKVKGKDSAYS